MAEPSVLISSFWTSTDIVAAVVLSGSSDFQRRINALVKANYLASPPLVVAYALAGTVCTLKSLKLMCLEHVSLFFFDIFYPYRLTSISRQNQ